MKRGFIFSIDAFVAFTIMLVILQALIIISATPSSYYTGLSQANYLARDALWVTSNSKASFANGGIATNVTILGYVIGSSDPAAYRSNIGVYIPIQYGYMVDVWDSTSGWQTKYDTATDPNPANLHNKFYHKLKSPAYALDFGYVTDRRPGGVPYTYEGYCNGGNTTCDAPISKYREGHAELRLIRLTVYR